jgi:hypothetical protein
MHERHRALTPAIAGSYEEAASVCLSDHHSPPIEIVLHDNGVTSEASVSWTLPSSRVIGAWANEIDTTEDGAYGCVIAGIELLRGVFAVRRAETGTGADYYIGPPDSGIEDLEDCSRLEVSGVRDGDFREVSRRLAEKVEQARRGNSNLPALAGVMGFFARVLLVMDVGEGG